MGIFKFSDPPYGGKNSFVGSNEYNPWVLYIKLHLKMPGNEQLQISSPPTHLEVLLYVLELLSLVLPLFLSKAALPEEGLLSCQGSKVIITCMRGTAIAKVFPLPVSEAIRAWQSLYSKRLGIASC